MPKLENDNDLIFEADKSGMIHVRKNPGGSEVLPGYGTENFGVSAYEPVKKFPIFKFLLSTGAAGILAWRFRDVIQEQIQVLNDYALLLEEAAKS